jgi:hypothetical protein
MPREAGLALHPGKAGPMILQAAGLALLASLSPTPLLVAAVYQGAGAGPFTARTTPARARAEPVADVLQHRICWEQARKARYFPIIQTQLIQMPPCTLAKLRTGP